MEISQLREAPYEVGRWRLFDRLNSFAGPFTRVCRLTNPESARLLLVEQRGVQLDAWHQSGVELAALYSWNEARILFDRFSTSDGSDTVVVISAPTLEIQLSVDEFIMGTQSRFEDDWALKGSDD